MTAIDKLILKNSIVFRFLVNSTESVPLSVTLNLRKKCNLSEVLILCGFLEGKMAGGQGFEPW